MSAQMRPSGRDAESSDGGKDKIAVEHVERIATREQVPGHTNYYEKDGLRTYGDDEGERTTTYRTD